MNIEHQTGIDRLKTDLLTDCATELHAKTTRCEELELDNELLRAQIRLLECKLIRIGKSGRA